MLVDPCIFREPVIISSPFTEGPYGYDLRDVEIVLAYDLNEIGEMPKYYCGDAKIVFVDSVTGEPAPTLLFNNDEEESALVIYSNDVSMIGEHHIRFRYFYEDEPENYAESDLFTVVV